MSFARCEKCKCWGYPESHKCPPPWECSGPEDECGDDWTTVYAMDASEAAEKFNEQYDDNGEYPSEGDQKKIRVKVNGGIRTYTVTVSYSRDYTAEEDT